MTESFEIQMFVETDKPIVTVASPVGREAANKAFREACDNSPGKAFRMIQIICDFTTLRKHKPNTLDFVEVILSAR